MSPCPEAIGEFGPVYLKMEQICLGALSKAEGRLIYWRPRLIWGSWREVANFTISTAMSLRANGGRG